MYRIKQLFFVIILVIIPTIPFAQNTTNSPYTRYGYGNLADGAFASQRGMGGIGYGLRNSKIINAINPASYSNVDSMTLMFDLGVMAQSAWFEDGNNRESKWNGGLEYLALQFPIAKRLGVGAGLEPISNVGYRYGDNTELSDGDYAYFSYQGNGGLSQVYGTLSYNFFDKLSVGTKISYLFGDMRHKNQASYSSGQNYSTNWIDTLRINGLTYNLGIQYLQAIGQDQDIVIGAVYTPKIKVNGVVKSEVLRGTTDSDYHTYKDSIFEMPESYGIGITYNKTNKLTVGFDVLYQKWSKAKFYDQDDRLCDMLRFNLGGEYIPDILNRNFLKQIRYRVGAYYSDSYIKVGNAGYKEYGITMGFGIPTTDKRSIVNLSLEYAMLRPDAKNLIDEQFLKLTLSYTFNELWFFKRKIQ